MTEKTEPQPLTDAEVEEWLRLSEAATPGPWEDRTDGWTIRTLVGEGEKVATTRCGNDGKTEVANQEYIAFSNPAFAARAIARIRADGRRIREMEKYLEPIEKQQIQAALEDKTK